MPTDRDEKWLTRAVDLATANVVAGGGPFGAVLVRDGAELATGQNRVTLDNDPTAHAEVVAIRAACLGLADHRLSGCTLYASCEPCPLCLSAALWARVDRVVYAADRTDAARCGFDDGRFHELFGSPRESWPVPVQAARIASASAPFDAWLAKDDRVRY